MSVDADDFKSMAYAMGKAARKRIQKIYDKAGIPKGHPMRKINPIHVSGWNVRPNEQPTENLNGRGRMKEPEEHDDDCECLECMEYNDHYGDGYNGDCV